MVLYKAMYGIPDGKTHKVCTKGYRALADETFLDKDTVRDLLADFKAKGMIAEIASYDPDTRSPKSYAVYSYRSIKQAWRDANIFYVLPGRRPIFCDALGNPMTFTPTVGTASTVGAGPAVSPVGPTPTVGTSPPDPVGATHTAPVGARPTLPIEKKGKFQETSSTRSRLLEAIQPHLGIVDDGVLTQILAAVRHLAPDALEEEILAVVKNKCQIIAANPNFTNPAGVLISSIPEMFKGPSFQALRTALRQLREAEELKRATEAAAWRQVLNDPTMSEEMRQMARERLGQGRP
jgi:hypothetical protein